MRILITGGCGFIGSHLIDFHLKKGNEVITVDDLSTGSMENIAPFTNLKTFKFYHNDLLTWPEIAEAVQWADRVYHLASIVGIFRVLSEPLRVMEVNLNGTYRLFKTVAESNNRPPVIFTSSSVYGHSKKASMSEDDNLIVEPSNPLKIYAVSKLTAETLAIAFHKQYGLPITIVRLFNAVGPHQTGLYGMVVPRFIQQACSNLPLTVFGDGNQTRSFCDIRDILASMDLLDLDSNAFNIVNIGNDHEITINDLAQLVISSTNSTSIIKHIPYQDAYGMEYSDTAKRRPNIQKLKQLTGYEFQWPLEKTIHNLVSLYTQDNPRFNQKD